MVLTRRGFTLIELLIVIGVIAILTVAFLPTALKAPSKARDSGRIKTVNDIVAALEIWRGSGKALPTGTNGCLFGIGAGMATFANNFENNAFPVDGVGRQHCGGNNGYLYYNPTARTYVVGASLENSASANALLDTTAHGNLTGNTPNLAIGPAATAGTIQNLISTTAAGTAAAASTNPWYLVAGQ